MTFDIHPNVSTHNMADNKVVKAKHLPTKVDQPQDLAKQYGSIHTEAWVSYLPPSWIPYIQLARPSPPAEVFLIYFPHLFGVINSAVQQRSPASEVMKMCVIMLGGSFFFSNAIHICNDLVDAPIDTFVTRTSQRPIARGAVSDFVAFIFAGTQTLGAAVVLVYFLPAQSVLYAAPNLTPTIYYPWSKRHTDFARVVLGV
ncbi:hypothetical protein F4821DRAFT_248396 [Hypoxylon rubiginosum]|uniref:Uncharacterized protein n=1 Tax=Hypoxylon rubiginosum TaxID=110542 RepID=A0ACC0CND6_9PEZI|nr:hypothetical protein F4821DRAFT_248396 [Hypoxylon rubiginosum]